MRFASRRGANTRPSRQTGLTLVELLIVVIILAIIAAIVVPQLSASTDDAKVSAMQTNLAGMRSAIDIYYQQHGHYPGSVTAAGASCPSGGAAGTGNASSAAEQAKAFASQLTMYTNAAGQACSTTDATFSFGPYLKTTQLGEAGIPTNSVTQNNAVLTISSGDLNIASTVTNGGWKYDIVTGKVIADHSDFDHL